MSKATPYGGTPAGPHEPSGSCECPNRVFNSAPADAFDAPPPVETAPVNVKETEEAMAQIEQASELREENGAPQLVEYSNPKADELIKKSLLICNFDAAVQCCLDNNRLADALLLSTCGGEQLWHSTIDTYLRRQMATKPYMPLLSAIIKTELDQLVQRSPLSNNRWKEVLAIISQYAKSEEFPALCEILGQRLESETGDESVVAATLCFMCAMNVEKVVDIWVKETYKTHSTDALQKTIELISVYRHAVEKTASVQGYPAVMKQYIAYADRLAQNGQLDYAASYLSLVDTTEIDPNDPQWNGEPPKHWEEHNALSFETLVLLERIYGAHRTPEQSLSHIIPQRWFPFEMKRIGVAPAVAPEPVQQYSQPTGYDASASLYSGYGASQQSFATSHVQQQMAGNKLQENYPSNPQQQAYMPNPSQPTFVSKPPQPPTQQSSYGQPMASWNEPSYREGAIAQAPTGPPPFQRTSQNGQYPLRQASSPTSKPIPVNDGFGTTAGNATAGAKYGNLSSVPQQASTGFNTQTPASSQNLAPRQPGISQMSKQGPVTIMHPGVPQNRTQSQPEKPKPAPPAVVKREMPAGMQSVMDSLRKLCGQLNGLDLSNLDRRQLGEGSKALDALNEKLMTGKIPATLQVDLKELSACVAQYDLKKAGVIRLAMTRSSWAEQKDWLKGFTHLINLATKKFAPQQ